MVFFRAQPQVERSNTAQVVLVPRLGVPVYVESVDAAPAMLEVTSIESAPDSDAVRSRLKAMAKAVGVHRTEIVRA